MKDSNLSIHKFKTNSNNNYIFDNSTGLVIPSTEIIEYIVENFHISKNNLIETLQKKFELDYNESNYKYNYVKNLIDQGCFYVEKNERYLNENDCKKMFAKSNASQLILILTEECNLRCKYCIYSDNYADYKTYSEKKMTFEVAKEAIDYYMELHEEKAINGYRDCGKICFYGGESFLEFKLMEKIVNYCKRKKYDVIYNVTTNGTIMNDEIINLIIHNNFIVSFSLDGTKSNHDRNRVFCDNSGTFDILMNNIRKLQEEKHKRNISQYISFVCCFDSYTDMEKILEFFEDNKDLFDLHNVIFNEIYKYGTEYYNFCEKNHNEGTLLEDKDTFSKSVAKLGHDFLNNELLEIKSNDTLTSLFKYLPIYKHRAKGIYNILGNACVPGDKIAVDSDGNFYVCEKVNQQYKIGDVKSKIQWDKVKKMANEYLHLKNKNCANCTLSRLCDLCYSYLMKNDELHFNNEFCDDKKKQLAKSLTVLYSHLEKNANAFDLNNNNDEIATTFIEK